MHILDHFGTAMRLLLHFRDNVAQRRLHLGHGLRHLADLILTLLQIIGNLRGEIPIGYSIQFLNRAFQRLGDIAGNKERRRHADQQTCQHNDDKPFNRCAIVRRTRLIEILTGKDVTRRHLAQIIGDILYLRDGSIEPQALLLARAKGCTLLNRGVRLLRISLQLVQIRCHLLIGVNFLHLVDVGKHHLKIRMDFLGQHPVIHMRAIAEQQIGRIDINRAKPRIDIVDILRRHDILFVNVLYGPRRAAMKEDTHARNEYRHQKHDDRQDEDLHANGKICHVP